MAIDLILGTAGHIDHGKTALIRALTGVDTDRLPEEKKRGITIELGFARLDLGDVRLGIVDVPGHERFIRNMLAGATGMDIALLVVAADDSVMPQTREHLEILRLLNLHSGVIALTKCDLAQPDWIELVELEVRELVHDTFLADAPIVRTSATTGQGLEALRGALEAAVGSRSTWGGEQAAAPFRMAIDRTFTVAGYGTVVTGSVVSGSVRVGETLVVEPGGVAVRVRGIQNHDEPADLLHRGQRAAINVAGLHHDGVERGQELAAPGYLEPSRLLTVQLDLLPSAPRPLKNRSRVRLHLGTADVMATVALLPSPARGLAQGESTLAQLHLSTPVVATWRQPFVVRCPSPVETIGGGIVLQPSADRIRPRDTESIELALQLASNDDATRTAATYGFAGWTPLGPIDLARAAGVYIPEPIVESLLADGELLRFNDPRGGSVVVHVGVVAALGKRIAGVLAMLHRDEPLRHSFDVNQVLHRVGLPESIERIWSVIAKQLAAAGAVVVNESTGQLALPGKGPQLSRGEQQLFDTMVEQIRTDGIEPPSAIELTASATKNKSAVPKLLALAVANGLLAEMTDKFYLHTETLDRLKQTLREELAGGQGMTLSEIRELLDTTRKYAVPICEYLDGQGFTARRGDRRFLAEL